MQHLYIQKRGQISKYIHTSNTHELCSGYKNVFPTYEIYLFSLNNAKILEI